MLLVWFSRSIWYTFLSKWHNTGGKSTHIFKGAGMELLTKTFNLTLKWKLITCYQPQSSHYSRNSILILQKRNSYETLTRSVYLPDGTKIFINENICPFCLSYGISTRYSRVIINYMILSWLIVKVCRSRSVKVVLVPIYKNYSTINSHTF